MPESDKPSGDNSVISSAAPDPHPVRSRIERVIGAFLGAAGGIALGWILAESTHQPWQLPVLSLAVLGILLGLRFGREILETFM